MTSEHVVCENSKGYTYILTLDQETLIIKTDKAISNCVHILSREMSSFYIPVRHFFVYKRIFQGLYKTYHFPIQVSNITFSTELSYFTVILNLKTTYLLYGLLIVWNRYLIDEFNKKLFDPKYPTENKILFIYNILSYLKNIDTYISEQRVVLDLVFDMFKLFPACKTLNDSKFIIEMINTSHQFQIDDRNFKRIRNALRRKRKNVKRT